MPVVMKFGQTDLGTLYKQFCDVQQLMGDIGKKLVKGQLWAEVTIFGQMKVLPSMFRVISDHFCLTIIFHSITFSHLKWGGVMIYGHI